jgi:hypothetical protein
MCGARWARRPPRSQHKDEDALQELGGPEPLAEKLASHLLDGIDPAAAGPAGLEARRAAFGENRFADVPPKGFFILWASNLRDPIIIMLMVAALVRVNAARGFDLAAVVAAVGLGRSRARARGAANGRPPLCCGLRRRRVPGQTPPVRSPASRCQGGGCIGGTGPLSHWAPLAPDSPPAPFLAPQVQTILGAAVPSEREQNAWIEGVAIWVAVAIVSLVGEGEPFRHRPLGVPRPAGPRLPCLPCRGDGRPGPGWRARRTVRSCCRCLCAPALSVLTPPPPIPERMHASAHKMQHSTARP